MGKAFTVTCAALVTLMVSLALPSEAVAFGMGFQCRIGHIEDNRGQRKLTNPDTLYLSKERKNGAYRYIYMSGGQRTDGKVNVRVANSYSIEITMDKWHLWIENRPAEEYMWFWDSYGRAYPPQLYPYFVRIDGKADGFQLYGGCNKSTLLMENFKS